MDFIYFEPSTRIYSVCLSGLIKDYWPGGHHQVLFNIRRSWSVFFHQCRIKTAASIPHKLKPHQWDKINQSPFPPSLPLKLSVILVTVRLDCRVVMSAVCFENLGCEMCFPAHALHAGDKCWWWYLQQLLLLSPVLGSQGSDPSGVGLHQRFPLVSAAEGSLPLRCAWRADELHAVITWSAGTQGWFFFWVRKQELRLGWSSVGSISEGKKPILC